MARTGGVPTEVLRERERRAWELRQRSMTHDKIAAELEVDRTTITKMLGRLSARAEKQMMAEISEEKRAQVEQLRYIANQAMDAWERSKLAAKSVTKKTVKGRNRSFGRVVPDPTEEVTIQSEERVGERAFLEAAMNALADIRKIFGLNASEKHEVKSTEKVVFEVVRKAIPDPDADPTPETSGVPQLEGEAQGYRGGTSRRENDGSEHAGE